MILIQVKEPCWSCIIARTIFIDLLSGCHVIRDYRHIEREPTFDALQFALKLAGILTSPTGYQRDQWFPRLDFRHSIHVSKGLCKNSQNKLGVLPLEEGIPLHEVPCWALLQLGIVEILERNSRKIGINGEESKESGLLRPPKRLV